MTSPRRPCSALVHTVFRGVHLTEADASAGLALSTEAGWNQTTADWRFLLREGIGLGFEAADGTLVASATILAYQDRFAWIGMVLVSHAARRQRLATLLLHALLQLAEERSWVPLLDATPEGRQVYLPLGFRDLRGVTRWVAERPIAPTLAPQPELRALDTAAVPPCADWDAARFGANRHALLGRLRDEQPEFAAQQLSPDATLAGFGLARAGRTALQLGPIVADSAGVATSLLIHGLAQANGPVLIDAVDGRAEFEAQLRAAGFAPRRNFIRMMRGPGAEPGRPDTVFAIAGPEFG